MELTLKDSDAIELPGWIGGSTLTLAEIGAVACFCCAEVAPDDDNLARRIASPEFKAAVDGLKAKGVFNTCLVDKTLTVQIDLDAVMP